MISPLIFSNPNLFFSFVNTRQRRSMAKASSSTMNCIRCVKSMGTFTCRGCDEHFCLNHANEHRQMLSKQMDEDIIPLHDNFQENLLELMNNCKDHLLMKDIDRWEMNSIELIRERASQLRKDLIVLLQKPIHQMKTQFEDLTQQLRRARQEDQFFENDLKRWVNELHHLSNQLKTPSEISFKSSNNNSPLISNISIENLQEYFEQSFGNIHIIDNGLKVVHNDTNTYASVRGSSDYHQGEHQLHFVIEHLTNNWIFFGVVSKTSPIPDYPSIGKTAYGWSGLNHVWRDGTRSTNFNGYVTDFQKDDQIHLTINCDQHFICLFNQRTNVKYQLNVDIHSCPFPWKLTVGFFHSPGESLRFIQ